MLTRISYALSVLCAAASLVCMMISGIHFLPRYPIPVDYSLPGIWLIAGIVLMGAALWLRGTWESFADIASQPTRIGTVRVIPVIVVIIGFAMMMITGELSARVFRLPGTEVPDPHLQYALWQIGFIVCAWGLFGAPSPAAVVRSIREHVRLARWEIVALVVITAASLFVRVVDLNTAVPRSQDEYQHMFALKLIESDTAVYFLTPPTDRGASTFVFPYWNYWTVEIFGRDLAGMRILSVIIGTLSVITIYGMARVTFDVKTALIAGILIAAFPPHLQLSRSQFPHITDVLFISALVMFVIYALKTGRTAGWIAAGICLSLTQYFVENGKLLVPLVVLAWFISMLILTPRRARKHWRGMLIVFVVGLLLAAPIYYGVIFAGKPFVIRVSERSLFDALFAPLIEGGLTFDEILQVLGTLLNPLLTYVSYPENSEWYGVQQPLLLYPLVPLFLLGIAYLIWRIRNPAASIILLIFVMSAMASSFVALSHSLMRHSLAVPMLIVTVAIGIRYGLPLIVPRIMFTAQRVGIVGYAMIGVVVSLAITQGDYYFNRHVPTMNMEYWQTMGRPDEQDAVLRAVSQYDMTVTQLVLISEFNIPLTLPNELMSFYQPGSMGIRSYTLAEFTPQVITELERDVNTLFFVQRSVVEQDTDGVMTRLREAFPELSVGEESPNPALPPQNEFLMFSRVTSDSP